MPLSQSRLPKLIQNIFHVHNKNNIFYNLQSTPLICYINNILDTNITITPDWATSINVNAFCLSLNLLISSQLLYRTALNFHLRSKKAAVLRTNRVTVSAKISHQKLLGDMAISLRNVRVYLKKRIIVKSFNCRYIHII